MSAVTAPSTLAEDVPKARTNGTFLEFLLVGGATLFAFPIAWLARRALGLDSAELAIGFLTFYAAYVVNDPHFSVTYILFYKDVRKRVFEGSGAARVRWIVSGVVVPIALLAWATTAFALRSAVVLGAMVQLMYLLVGWHYAKQGFGVLTVLSARRGIVMTARERVVILAHCMAAWAFAWANPSVPAIEVEERGVVYVALAHPRWLEIAAGIVLAATTLALAFVLLSRVRREGRTLPLAPLAGFLVTIWSWTIFTAADPLVRYAIPALHSVQYFYFVWLMKRNQARAEEGPPVFGRPAPVRLAILAASALGLGWILFHGLPEAIDAAVIPRGPNALVGDLGETPFFAAFYVFVNIHHYFMDHVIWRRDNPDTRWLKEDPKVTGRGLSATPLHR